MCVGQCTDKTMETIEILVCVRRTCPAHIPFFLYGVLGPGPKEGVNNIVRVQVYAAHMIGFWARNSVNGVPKLWQVFINYWWVFQKFPKIVKNG